MFQRPPPLAQRANDRASSAELFALTKSSSQYRRDVAALKRQVATLNRQVALLASHARAACASVRLALSASAHEKPP